MLAARPPPADDDGLALSAQLGLDRAGGVRRDLHRAIASRWRPMRTGKAVCSSVVI